MHFYIEWDAGFQQLHATVLNTECDEKNTLEYVYTCKVAFQF